MVGVRGAGWSLRFLGRMACALALAREDERRGGLDERRRAAFFGLPCLISSCLPACISDSYVTTAEAGLSPGRQSSTMPDPVPKVFPSQGLMDRQIDDPRPAAETSLSRAVIPSH